MKTAAKVMLIIGFVFLGIYMIVSLAWISEGYVTEGVIAHTPW